jgi:transcriptional regulator with XRE-family HTH domain
MAGEKKYKVPENQDVREILGDNLGRFMRKSTDLRTSRQVETKSRELGDGVGIDRRQYEKIVKGKIGTGIETVAFLAKLFDKEPHELLIDRRELLRGSITNYEKNVNYSPDSTMQTTGQKAKQKGRS